MKNNAAVRQLTLGAVAGLTLTVCPLHPQPFPERIDLATMTAEDGIVFRGTSELSWAGDEVARVGDVNNDGLDDIAITAPFADTNGGNSGEVYVIFGNTSVVVPELRLDQLDGSNGFVLRGVSAGDETGGAVGGGGDVNGDGFDDLVIGADRAGPVLSGQSFLVFGRPSWPPVIELGALNGVNGVRIDGADSLDKSGNSVDILGDFDGDGFDDVVIGAWQADPNGQLSGQAGVIFGKAVWPAEMSLTDLDGTNGFTVNGTEEDDAAGAAVSRAGDVNGDGLDDLLVGAAWINSSDVSEAHILFGRPRPISAEIELSEINGANGVTLLGGEGGDRTGGSLGPAGDVNQDGLDDVIIGAFLSGTNGPSSGTSYVVFGQETFPASIELNALDGQNGFALYGIAIGDSTGGSVDGAGDFNGDGFPDVVIGASGVDGNKPNSGESYVVFGQSAAPATFELADLNGLNGLAYAGICDSGSVTEAGDFNGDGVADILIGDITGDDRMGMAHLLFGRTETGITLGATGGSCPGTVRLRSKGLTARGVFALYRGSARGDGTIPNGACAGLPIDLDSPTLVRQLSADEDGRWTFILEVSSPATCGLTLQAVDLDTCRLSNVTTVPDS